MLTLRSVFEGRCHPVLKITIENARRQRDRSKTHIKAPLNNTVRTPTSQALFGEGDPTIYGNITGVIILAILPDLQSCTPRKEILC